MELLVTNKWIKWGLFNLAIVALYGMLMRYKIGFNFPVFDQKNLLHAHSHFAFSGWISHLLYSSLALLIQPYLQPGSHKKYNWLLIMNLLCSFGMLIAFTAQGYKMFSIAFSTLSIFIAIAYTVVFLNDLKRITPSFAAKPWAVAGLLLNILSAAGPLFLAYMMVTKTVSHHYYLGSVYYFLHFQYSGWFFFGAMALVVSNLPPGFGSIKKYFTVFIITVIPTFFLSVLWAKLPLWLYTITAIAGVVQLLAWMMLFSRLLSFIKSRKKLLPGWVNILFYTSAIALSIKFLLQAVSVIPSLSQLVFGIRPIVIAYLHLILLAVYTLFFVGYAFAKGFVKKSTIARYATVIFLSGVFVNEILLGIQGFTAFFYIPVAYINQMLFGTAIILFAGAAGLFLSQMKEEQIKK